MLGLIELEKLKSWAKRFDPANDLDAGNFIVYYLVPKIERMQKKLARYNAKKACKVLVKDEDKLKEIIDGYFYCQETER
jgi:hypothetical protein